MLPRHLSICITADTTPTALKILIFWWERHPPPPEFFGSSELRSIFAPRYHGPLRGNTEQRARIIKSRQQAEDEQRERVNKLLEAIKEAKAEHDKCTTIGRDPDVPRGKYYPVNPVGPRTDLGPEGTNPPSARANPAETPDAPTREEEPRFRQW